LNVGLKKSAKQFGQMVQNKKMKKKYKSKKSKSDEKACVYDHYHYLVLYEIFMAF